jgi:multiple sugar transport system ATP-binding protein
MAGVELAGVRKVYENGFVAVHDASFAVEAGELIVLVGPSGCGKSTTLRMIAGLESITAGVLRIGDRVVNAVPASARDIAMVFQNYALYPHMSIYENMAFALRLRNTPRKEIEQRVLEAATILNLESLLDRKPRQLSGGQRQRVAVGRAIVRQPRVFLFDEPLSNLDAKLRVQTRKEISRLHRQLGATMVYVTHDQVEAMTLGDRIVVMNAGHIQQIGTPLELYNSPANEFVAGFIGSPAMNLWPGHIVMEADHPVFVERGGQLHIDLFRIATSLEGVVNGAVTLGIRPEDIYPAGESFPPPINADLRARVDVVEPMGNEVFLYLRAEDVDVVARTRPVTLPQPDEVVSLTLDLSKLHFFDASGRRL